MTEAIVESMDREKCLYRFRYASLKFTNAFIPITIARFYPEEIVCLVRVMEIPNPFQTESRYNFTAVEALCILLARLRFSGDQNDLVMLYDHTQAAVSDVVNELAI
jgi:hypothetical protein